MTHEDKIEIIGASENNLKHISLEIPKGKLVVLCGVSGSGKSSLAFDTIAVESARQWQSSYPLFLRNKMPHYERPSVESISGITPTIIVDQRAFGAGSRSTVGTAVDVAPLIRLMFSRIGKPSAGGSMAYSFNHPMGMCPECSGLGTRLVLREDKLFDMSKTLAEGAICFSQFSSGWQTYLYQNNPLLDPNKRLCDFTPEEMEILKNGTENTPKIEIRSNNTGRIDKVDYEGVLPRFRRLYLDRDITKLKQSLQDEILSLVEKAPCPICNGTGLNPKALASKINGRNIIDFLSMPVSELIPVLKEIDDVRGISLSRQICAYLERMVDIGIGYLSLGRRTDTLSGGEVQRIKIVRNLSSSLSNVTYIFDEPTAGLHPADIDRVSRLLKALRDRHNNVIVVEHNRQIIEIADHTIELGELAGTQGGNIVFQGTLDELKQADTYTARTLRNSLTVRENTVDLSGGYEVRNAHSNNLKHIDVTFPRAALTAVTGVAGSGKSSLVCGELARRYPQAIVIDQKPIGTSIRSTPATYTGIMDDIRKMFAKENGVGAEWFSFNSKGGCEVCKGKGEISYEMAFAEPVVVPCEECGGRRYNPTALSYTYHSKTIEEVMGLTIGQALGFFDSKKIQQKLKTLADVGLEYLTLGQPTSTLSGGETQRLKLASELTAEGNLYILDEPTTGLHAKDIEKLTALFRRLIDRHNTVVIVEHRLEMISQADYIIDMGPEGGSSGGEVVFTGTPAEIVDSERSKTGRYLKELCEK